MFGHELFLLLALTLRHRSSHVIAHQVHLIELLHIQASLLHLQQCERSKADSPIFCCGSEHQRYTCASCESPMCSLFSLLLLFHELIEIPQQCCDKDTTRLIWQMNDKYFYYYSFTQSSISMSITDEVIQKLNQMLSSNSSDYVSATSSLFNLMEQAFSNYDYDKNSLRKKTVNIVGTTGAGKSTLVNYLAGVRMKSERKKGSVTLDVLHKEQAVAKIGVGKGKSETIYPNIYVDKKNQLTYVDNPGDNDSRGITQQILNSYVKYKLGDSIDELQVLIVVSYSSLSDSNATTLVSYLNLFVLSWDNNDQLLNHVFIVFSRTPYSEDLNCKQIILDLQEVRDNNSNLTVKAKAVLDYICRNQKVGIFYSPTQSMIVSHQYTNPAINEQGTGLDIINQLKKNPFYMNKFGKNLYKLTVTDGETIARMIDGYEKIIPRLIIKKISQQFLGKVNRLEDFQKLVELNTFCQNQKIIKKGQGTNMELETFYKAIGLGSRQIDQLMNYDNFLHQLKGQTTFVIKLSQIHSLFTELKIGNMLKYSNEPHIIEDTRTYSDIYIKGSEGYLEELKQQVTQKKIIIYSSYQINFSNQTNWNWKKSQNLIIFSPIWKNQKGVTISLQGADGVQHASPNPDQVAERPKVGELLNGLPGANGISGKPGQSGKHGGNFILMALKNIKRKDGIVLNTKGGRGANGQNGGKGGTGGEAGDSKPLGQGSSFFGSMYRYLQGTTDFASYNRILKFSWGGYRGKGGNSSLIGKGGVGGKAGVVELFVPKDLNILKLDQIGQNGLNGKPGLPGDNGRFGRWAFAIQSSGYPQTGHHFRYLNAQQEKEIDRRWSQRNHLELKGELKGEQINTLNPVISLQQDQKFLNFADQLRSYYLFLLDGLKKEGLARQFYLIILKKMIGEENQVQFKKEIPNKNENRTQSNIFKSIIFINKHIPRSLNEMLLMAIKSTVQSNNIIQMEQTNEVEFEDQKIVKKVRNVGDKDQFNIQRQIKRLMCEITLLFQLWNEYCNGDTKINGKQLIMLFECFIDKIVYKMKEHYFSFDRTNQLVIQKIYAYAFNCLCSLKAAYNVVSFDFLQYLYNYEILDYKKIVQTKQKVLKKQQYLQKIKSKDTAARQITQKLQIQMEELLKSYDTSIKTLMQDMQNTFKQKEDYANQLKKQSTLRIFSSILKMFGSIACFFGPYGLAIGGAAILGGSIIDIFTPQLKPISFKDLNPASYLTLQNNQYKLDIKQFIDSIDEVRNQNKDIPTKVKLIEQAKQDPAKFTSKYSKIVDIQVKKAQKDLSDPAYTKQMKESGKLARSYEQYQTLKRVTYIGAAIQTANNIITGVQDTLNVLNEVDKSFKDAESFKKTKQQLKETILSHQTQLTQSLLNMNDNLEKTNSRAVITYMQYSYKKCINNIEITLKSALKGYEYGDKDNLMNTFNLFYSSIQTLISIHKEILDLEDQSDLANLIVGSAQSDSQIETRYPGFFNLEQKLKESLLMKEANDILYTIKQSAFPASSFFSYDSYRDSFNEKDLGIQHLILKIKQAYKENALNKYAIAKKDNYLIIDRNMQFAKIVDMDKCQLLLKGKSILLFIDIRQSIIGQEAIKFKTIRLSIQLNNPKKKEILPQKIAQQLKKDAALQIRLQQAMENYDIQMKSSGDYYYRYNQKYYKFSGPVLSLSQSYIQNQKIRRMNQTYQKIILGNAIFSPYTTWKITLTNTNQANRKSLYDTFENILGDNISRLQLRLQGSGMYLKSAFDSNVWREIVIDKCYSLFQTELSETPINFTMQ